MDMISKLPPDIIKTILCFLPTKDAARTSILAKEWRYRWTKVPKLKFMPEHWGLDPFLIERVTMIERCKFFYAISQVLLIHEGPIDKFTLYMATDDTCVEIDHIIHHLSRKFSVKKLKLKLIWYTPPSSLFSLHQLTYLYLSGCVLDRHQPSFIEFGSLTSLFLDEVVINEKALLHLLSHCPLLKILEMDYEPRGETDMLTIINLFECLPLIENLFILFKQIECFAKNGFPRELPTALVHLKYLWIKDISITHEDGPPIIALFLRSSLNLEKLWLIIAEDEESDERSDAVTLDDYSDIWLEHLSEFQIIYRDFEKSEFEFVKLILTKSPVLKKLKIFFDVESNVTEDEAREISVILFISPHASPAVEIVVEVLKDFSYPKFSKNLIT